MKKLAFVTGATSGIGLAVAKKFASMGINIAFNGKAQNSKELEDIQKLFGDQYKIDSFYQDADVSKREQLSVFHENVLNINSFNIHVIQKTIVYKTF